jgi:hypothetical protein
MSRKTITEYDIITHGVDWPDYFPGCGLAFTNYDDVATGIGNSEREAAEDALDQLAQANWDTDSNPGLAAEVNALSDDDEIIDEIIAEDNDGEDQPYVYVSIRVR